MMGVKKGNYENQINEGTKMKSLKFFKPALATTLGIALASLLSIRPAQAGGYIVKLQQVGPDVVATGSGAIDLTGLTFSSSASVSPEMLPEYMLDQCSIDTGLPFSSVDSYGAELNGPTSFGKNQFSSTAASSGSGDMVGIGAILSFLYKGMVVSVPK